ncbi:MAG: ferrous iron transport protein B [Fimbriiglobus sp.]
MSTPTRIALVGNPNAGKSTLFNALSGLRQQVGNYPGVTVEMKKGRFSHAGQDFEVLDLPGTYSLAARSPDERVAVDLLLGTRPNEPRPQVVVVVVDASNLDRHLYLATQVLDLGIPVILALNMIDTAKAQKIEVDVAAIGTGLGIPVVAIQANQGIGLDLLRETIVKQVGQPAPPTLVFPDLVEAEARGLQDKYGLLPFQAKRVLLDVEGDLEKSLTKQHGPETLPTLQAARVRLEAAKLGVAGVEARTRYGFIRKLTSTAVKQPKQRVNTWTDRLDKVLTHRVWGTLVFLVVMFIVFQSIFVWAEPLKGPIEAAQETGAKLFQDNMSAGPLRDLLTDGVLKGVGGILVFLPQILILFGFIAILEDCGYMARAAYLMDRIMSRCGLNGKSFIPLLSSVACAVPGILATRVIENRRDRLATILVAPLMSCSARLPVYALFISAFMKDGYPWWLPGLTLFAMYMIGFITAPLVALLLKRTLLRGETPLFVLELPSYKRPSLRTVFFRMWDAGWAFVKRAGTVILASMVIVWALLYFPNHDGQGQSYPERIATQPEDAEAEKDRLNGEWKRNSYLGQVGRGLEPVFQPLGWDWKIGMAVVASFPAREVIVGTMGIIYDVGDVDPGEIDNPDDDKATSLRTAIQDDWKADPTRSKYGVGVALSVMVFFALCCQCASTLATIRRETKSWLWPLFTFTYMTALAYVAAWATFQVSRWLI